MCAGWGPAQAAVSYTHLDVYKRQVSLELVECISIYIEPLRFHYNETRYTNTQRTGLVSNVDQVGKQNTGVNNNCDPETVDVYV